MQRNHLNKVPRVPLPKGHRNLLSPILLLGQCSWLKQDLNPEPQGNLCWASAESERKEGSGRGGRWVNNRVPEGLPPPIGRQDKLSPWIRSHFPLRLRVNKVFSLCCLYFTHLSSLATSECRKTQMEQMPEGRRLPFALASQPGCCPSSTHPRMLFWHLSDSPSAQK